MPNFGLLKEQIFASLEDKYSKDKKLFIEGVNNVVKSLKKSKTLNELFQHYHRLLSSHFDDKSTAKEYITETVEYLKSLEFTDSDINLLEGLDKSEVEVNKYVLALDTLVFGDKKNIQERIEAKKLLTDKLITETTAKQIIDPQLKGVFLDILKAKLESKLKTLNESEFKTIQAFADNDEDAILANYIRLIDDNVNIIQEQMDAIKSTAENTDGEESLKKLSKVKGALVEMRKSEKPTLNDVERLFVLRDGFV